MLRSIRLPPESLICILLLVGIRQYGFVGYRLYQVDINNAFDLATVQNLSETSDVDMWREPVLYGQADLMTVPSQDKDVKSFLDHYGIKYRLINDKIGRAIDPLPSEIPSYDDSTIFWKDYKNISTIYSWLDDIAENYSFVELIDIGTTSEGNILKLVKISSNGLAPHPGIFIEGGIFGREWSSVSSALYVINELVLNYNSNKQLTDAFDWFILPIANPDGYEYSRTVNRLWQKTRSGSSSRHHCNCRGVSLNRNFGTYFKPTGNPCTNSYSGPSPFSEPEANAIADFIMQRKTLIKGYFSIKSYTYETTMLKAAKSLEDLLKVFERSPNVPKSGNDLLLKSGGSSTDWAWDEAGIPYATGIPITTTKEIGFLIPEHKILPVAQTAWNDVKVLANVINIVMHSKKHVKGNKS